MFNQGISREGDLLDLSVTHQIVKKSGAFYSFGEIQIGRGRENAKTFHLLNFWLRIQRDSTQLTDSSTAPPYLSCCGSSVVHTYALGHRQDQRNRTRSPDVAPLLHNKWGAAQLCGEPLCQYQPWKARTDNQEIKV